MSSASRESPQSAAAAPDLSHLLSSFRVGNVELRNRIVSPPHATLYADGGLPSERQRLYYAERAKGGVGLIVTGSWLVHPRAQGFGGENIAADPRAVDGHRRIAEAVHRHGTRISAQLHFAGRQGTSGYTRLPMLAPSPIPCPEMREIPKEFEPDEIEDLIDRFGVAAAAVKKGEWDGVEVFAAQGYGLSQFLSPHVNRRTDEWGGDGAGRLRILTRVLERVREAVGRDYLVGVRMNASDFVEGGLELPDACAIARQLEATGQVDYLNVSGATNNTFPLWIADMGHPQDQFVPLAAELRKATSLPLMIVSRIKDPVRANAIIAAGHADLVGMNRALIADPELPNKARAGRLRDIRPCVGGNQACLGRGFSSQGMSCSVNPGVGLESEYGVDAIGRADRRLRVVVVGGGPAGLEAARVATLRGHEVTLYEEHDTVGGQIALAARVPSRAEFGGIVDWLAGQLEQAGVDVRLGQRADARMLASCEADVIVFATGSRPLRTGFSSFRPSVEAIPGHDLPHVLDPWQVFDERTPIGDRVLVVEDDPHVHATTVAELLGGRGKAVTIVSRSPYVGIAIGQVNLQFLYKRLAVHGIQMLANTWIDEITGSGAIGYDVYSERRFPLAGFDTVVLATGNRVEDSTYRELSALGPDIRLERVGDCLAPRKLDHAIWDGLRVASAL